MIGPESDPTATLVGSSYVAAHFRAARDAARLQMRFAAIRCAFLLQLRHFQFDRSNAGFLSWISRKRSWLLKSTPSRGLHRKRRYTVSLPIGALSPRLRACGSGSEASLTSLAHVRRAGAACVAELTIAVANAGLADGTPGTRIGAAAVDICFNAILAVINALVAYAEIRDGVARIRKAVGVDVALQAIDAGGADTATTINIGLQAVLTVIGALVGDAG